MHHEQLKHYTNPIHSHTSGGDDDDDDNSSVLDDLWYM